MKLLDTIKVLKHGTHGYYDVFYGDGWENHFKVRFIKGSRSLVYQHKVTPRMYSKKAKEIIIEKILSYKQEYPKVVWDKVKELRKINNKRDNIIKFPEVVGV